MCHDKEPAENLLVILISSQCLGLSSCSWPCSLHIQPVPGPQLLFLAMFSTYPASAWASALVLGHVLYISSQCLGLSSCSWPCSLHIQPVPGPQLLFLAMFSTYPASAWASALVLGHVLYISSQCLGLSSCSWPCSLHIQPVPGPQLLFLAMFSTYPASAWASALVLGHVLYISSQCLGLSSCSGPCSLHIQPVPGPQLLFLAMFSTYPASAWASALVLGHVLYISSQCLGLSSCSGPCSLHIQPVPGLSSCSGPCSLHIQPVPGPQLLFWAMFSTYPASAWVSALVLGHVLYISSQCLGLSSCSGPCSLQF